MDALKESVRLFSASLNTLDLLKNYVNIIDNATEI